MFRVTDKTMKIVNLNFRAEKHGPNEMKNALDITVSADFDNTVLDLLIPGMRERFYREAPKKKGEPEQAEIEVTTANLPDRIDPEIKTISHEHVMAGATFRMPYGIDPKEDQKELVLIDRKVDGFSITFKHEGIVNLKFKISGLFPDEDAPIILGVQGREATITIEPPSPQDAAQQEIDAMSEEVE